MKAANKMTRAYKMLSQCNQTVIRATNEQGLLSEICDIVVHTGGYRLAWIGIACEDIKKNVTPVAYTGFEEGYLDKLNIVWSNTKQGRGPIGNTIRTGKVTCIRYGFFHGCFLSSPITR